MIHPDHLDLYEGSTGRMQNLIVTTGQVPIVPDDVLDWSARAYDASSGRLVKTLQETTTETTGYFFSPLQTGNGWTRNAVGYNFEFVLAHDAFRAHGGRSYRIEFQARTSTERMRWAWLVTYEPWLGSPHG